MKCFKNFDQNSGDQSQYLTSQLQDLILLLVMKLRLGVKQINLGSRKIIWGQKNVDIRSPSWELGFEN